MLQTLLLKPMSAHTPRIHSVWQGAGKNQSAIFPDQQLSLLFEEVGNQPLLKLIGKILIFKLKPSLKIYESFAETK